jgi:hypothetical protein
VTSPGGSPRTPADRLARAADRIAAEDRWHDDKPDRRRRLARTLADLPEQYVHLYLALPKSGSAGERVSGSRDAPTPPDLQVDALMRDIAATVTEWEAAVRAAAGLTPFPRSSHAGGAPIARACRTLTAHIDTLLALPAQRVREWDPEAGKKGTVAGAHFRGDSTKIGKGALGRSEAPDGAWVWAERTGAEGARQLNRLGGLAFGMLGTLRLVHRLPVPCPACGVMALTREDGASEVRCEACGISEPEGKYQHFAKVMAEEMAEQMRREAQDTAG